MRGALAVAAMGLLLAGCGTTKHQIRTEEKVVRRDGVVSVWATWVKDKGDKFDLGFHIRNEAPTPILIRLSEISCARGRLPGTVRHPFFGAGERSIDLEVGETKSFTLVCHYGAEATGAYRVIIHRVYRGPDKASPGEVVLAEDVEWTAPDGSAGP
jgi:hypothetical protein